MKNLTILIFVCITWTIQGQISRPSFNIHYLEQDPIIDGDVLNESLWQNLTPLDQLTQIRPNFGEPASEKTHIWVAMTNKTLYISVVCYDNEPHKIVVSDSRRDADLNDEDSFLFIIDTYNDQQNGFLFGTNSNGMEYDAQIDREGIGIFSVNRQQGGVIGGTNLNWDAAWDVKTKTGSFGWSAEFAIPLRSIRFNSGDNKTWGINFQRNISKRTETTFWAPLPIGFDLKRLSMAGKMHGLNLKSPKNLKIIPYALVQNSTELSEEPTSNKAIVEAGVDVKYSLTPGLTLDLTYNTDFAQVEVDDQQVNLDRFNLFFPEKRPFFLENAGQFTVGSPGEVDLFFSRRIGIGEGGRMVPIIGGSRVSGKIGQTNVGFLSMFTEDVQEFNLGKNNFTAARINHDFPSSRSSIGGLVVGRYGMEGLDGDNNTVLALDGKWGIGKKALVSGFFAKSQTPGITNNDHTANVLVNYLWNRWNFRVGYTEVAPGFNPEVGFLLRSGFRKPEFLILRNWRPKNWGPLLELRPHISYRGYWNFDNRYETGFLHIDNHWEFKSGFEVHTGLNLTLEGVFRDLNIFGVTVPENTYRHSEAMLVMITNPNQPVAFNNRTIIGGYFGGKRVSSTNTLNMRFGDKLNASLILNYNNLKLPGGDINAVISGARLAYSFTPRIFLQSLIQYNNTTELISLNARFGWLQSSNTGLFVVYNILKDQDPFDLLNNHTVTIKYTHQFDLLGKR